MTLPLGQAQDKKLAEGNASRIPLSEKEYISAMKHVLKEYRNLSAARFQTPYQVYMHIVAKHVNALLDLDRYRSLFEIYQTMNHIQTSIMQAKFSETSKDSLIETVRKDVNKAKTIIHRDGTQRKQVRHYMLDTIKIHVATRKALAAQGL